MSNIVDELYSVADYIIEKSLNRGATEVEVYAVHTRSAEALIHNNKLHTATELREIGVGIRVAIGKKVGFSYTNRLDSDSLISAVEYALNVAKGTPEDKFWRGFPGGPFTYTTPSNVFSDALAQRTASDAVERVREVLDYALRDKRITVVYAGLSYSMYEHVIVNSNGVHGNDKGTSTFLGVEVVANEAGYTTPSIYESCIHRVSECDVKVLVERVVDKALKALKPIKIGIGTYDVVLEPEALATLFNYTLKPALRGDNVIRNRSPLKGKEGTQIALKTFTVVDDGLVPGGPATSKFDGEGVPKRRTELIVRGVLRGFIYDTYWGRRAEKQSTGNAVRASYATQPSIGFSNFIISCGTESIESYINKCERAVLVADIQGAHSSNPETGEFSVVANPSWIVSKGEMKALKGVMLAGNIWKLIKRIEYLSKEVKTVRSSIIPWIAFSNVRVIIQ